MACPEELEARFDRALGRATAFFGHDVRGAAIALTRRLDGVPHAYGGTSALAAHGLRRVTRDLQLLVGADGLAALDQRLGGDEYVALGRRRWRDVTRGVEVRAQLADAAEVQDHLPPLERLIERSLIAGRSAHRLIDLADVLEVIRARELPRDFSLRLDPEVRAAFDDLWVAAQGRDPDA